MRSLSRIGLALLPVAAAAAMIGFGPVRSPSLAAEPAGDQARNLPRLLDLGSKQCVPCKMMAPILEELARDYAGKFKVEFIDVWLKENVATGKRHRIKVIPTQIFFSPEGKELWRHEGFLGKDAILAKWKELGHDVGAAQPARIERWEPAKADTRGKDAICYLCDGGIHPKTTVTVRTEKGPVKLCGLHCYFIMISALTEYRSGFEKKVFVTDYAAGKPVPAGEAFYLYGLAPKTGRPWIKAFSGREAAEMQRRTDCGSVIGLEVLKRKEFAHRCGFCDRAMYPEDGSVVKTGGVHTLGCCPHCALGVAARTGKDIEVHQGDALTGEMIVIKTLNGQVASLEPQTAVAWFGMRKKPDGTWGSAGCFHQANFTCVENLKTWLTRNPLETGKLITVQQALSAKMKMTPGQIAKACKIGECTPK